MRCSSLKERLRLLTKELKINPEYQKDLKKLQAKLNSKNLNIEQFEGKAYIKAFTAKNNFFLKWELKDWVCGEPILNGLEVESDFIRQGKLLYVPSWATRGDIRSYLPHLKEIVIGKRLDWGHYKGNDALARLRRNRKIRREFKALRKKGIKSIDAICIISTKMFREYNTIRQIVHNPKFDK